MLWVPTETLGVTIDPGDSAAHLLGHRQKTATHVLHPGEVRHHEMGPGVDEQLGCKGVVLGQATAPRPPMDEDIDRRAGACGAVDVECLDRGRTVGIELGSALQVMLLLKNLI